MPIYVAADGNWGDAEGIALIDDQDWTEAEYTMLNEESDHNKADLAEKISVWISRGRPEGDFETWEVTT